MKKKKISHLGLAGCNPSFHCHCERHSTLWAEKKKSCHMIFYEFYQYTYTCKLKDPRAGRPCASVRRKLEVSVCSKFIEKNQIIINSMKYILCVIYILMITILNISSIMIQILSCFIVISHIIYFNDITSADVIFRYEVWYFHINILVIPCATFFFKNSWSRFSNCNQLGPP